jgi:hypothetical protein
MAATAGEIRTDGDLPDLLYAHACRWRVSIQKLGTASCTAGVVVSTMAATAGEIRTDGDLPDLLYAHACRGHWHVRRHGESIQKLGMEYLRR